MRRPNIFAIKGRLASIAVCAAICMLISAAVILVLVRRELQSERIEKARAVVDSLYSVAEGFQAEAASGRLSAEAARQRFIEAAQKVKLDPARGFARGFFAKLVPNVRKLGLLDANSGYLREKWGAAGLLEFEFADDTGSDYESYDAVARDRAAMQAGAEPEG